MFDRSARKIYFFINGVAVVSRKPSRVRGLPEPWPLLLDGSWERIFRKPWIQVFADFLEAHGENPSHFELHYPDGHVCKIYLDKDMGWDYKFARDSEPFYTLGFFLSRQPSN